MKFLLLIFIFIIWDFHRSREEEEEEVYRRTVEDTNWNRGKRK